jgi:hypothetical protein
MPRRFIRYSFRCVDLQAPAWPNVTAAACRTQPTLVGVAAKHENYASFMERIALLDEGAIASIPAPVTGRR